MSPAEHIAPFIREHSDRREYGRLFRQFADQDVARFEALIQHQGTAVRWTPVTPFDYESRKAIEGRHPDLILDTFQPTRVLDFGCGPDRILMRLLQERRPDLSIAGYDIQIPGSETDLLLGVYDLVICREVLEHCPIRELVDVVRMLAELSTKYLYVTTRYAKDPDHLLDVDTSDDLDPTHITMLTKPFLRTLFVLEGCKSRPDLEAKLDWQGKGRCLVFEVPR